jgi:lysophospholipase L1-like esterase
VRLSTVFWFVMGNRGSRGVRVGGTRKMKRLVPCAAIGLALVLATALRLPATAPADTQPLLGVGVGGGHIAIAMIAPVGSEVTFYEEIAGVREEIGKAFAIEPPAGGPDGYASIPALTWRCDRTVRRIIGVARKPDTGLLEAFNDARTPNCSDRFLIQTPTRVEPGARVPITVKDRWQIGDVSGRLCITRTGAARTCSRVAFKPEEKTLSFSRGAGNRVALMDLDFIVAGTHHHQRLGVGRVAPAAARPVALVTGDSMMTGIDTILAEKLKTKFRVIGQTRPGTGVSKKLDTPWTAFARQQVVKHKPAVTMVLLGGNDGYPMTTAAGTEVKCCGESWRLEYLERIKQMATAYARDGRGRVIWSLLPPPRRSDLAEQMGAVNDAIRRLAAAMPDVQIVPLDEIFGPKYKDEINGRQVRDPDGLHFSLAGQRIAAQAIIDALRKVPASLTTPPITTTTHGKS